GDEHVPLDRLTQARLRAPPAARPSVIVFPEVECPLVSIAMVTYGRWALTRAALEAVVEHTDPCYEVILVDNASTDGTDEHLDAEVRGATVVLNDRNYGFGPGANLAAQRA